MAQPFARLRWNLWQMATALAVIAAGVVAALVLDDRAAVVPLFLLVVLASCAWGPRAGLMATLPGAVLLAIFSRSFDSLLVAGFSVAGAATSLLIGKLLQQISRLRIDRDRILANEEKLRLLVDSVQDYALCVLDSEGRIASWNSGAERILGYRADGIIGRHVCCLYTDAATDAGVPANELELAQAVGRCEQSDWQVRRDGTRLRTHRILRAIHDGDGQLRGFAVVMRELSVAPTPRSLTGLLDEHRRGLELALISRT